MSYTITVNFEIQNGGKSPMPLTKYVYALESNPATIEEGSSATLDFAADGLYFVFLKAKALAAKVTGASFTWTSVSPFTSGQIVLSNPTDNVVINLRAKVNVIPQEVTRPFLLQKNFPVDTRLVLTKKEMREITDDYMPIMYFALCKDDSRFYLYNKNSEITEDTGKFVLLSDIVESEIDSFDGGEIT